MSFRKRNKIIGTSGTSPSYKIENPHGPGTRPSPLDGRVITSSGTASLDQLIAGYSGLPIGTSLLFEEEGTTEFGGVLLRYFAAEGLVQGHEVHVLGFGPGWRRELPGLSKEIGIKESRSANPLADGKMKIAWRYEALENHYTTTRTQILQSVSDGDGLTFCHQFDLSKRLDDGMIQGQLYSTSLHETEDAHNFSSLQRFISNVSTRLEQSKSNSIHRVIVPNALSPTMYGSSLCQPREILQFFHNLRGLLRRFPTRLIAFISLSTSLYPRHTGLIRRVEILCDGVIELIPFRHQTRAVQFKEDESKTQGLLRVHRLPVFHERGGGLEGSWIKEDLSFKLSASNGLVFHSFSLPPLGNEEEDTSSQASRSKGKKELQF